MLRGRVTDNNRGGVAERVTEPIPTFHLHNTHYSVILIFVISCVYKYWFTSIMFAIKVIPTYL